MAVTGVAATMPYIALQAHRHEGGLSPEVGPASPPIGRVANPLRHCVRVARGLYVHERIAGTRDDRIRKRRAHLHYGDRGSGHHSGKSRRLGKHFRFGASGAVRAAKARLDCLRAEPLLRLFDARVRIRARAFHLPALRDQRAEREKRRRDPAELRASAALQYSAHVHRLAGDRAIAAGIHVKDNNLAIPQFSQFFPEWFAGVAFAAIVIGALVPAAIMSIGAANLFASNILQTFRARLGRPAVEANIARYLALIVLTGAFCIAVLVKPQFSINFQLLGGAWILQIFPAVILGLYVRRLHPRALLAGWVCGMVCATWMVFSTGFSSVFPLHVGGAVVPGASSSISFLVNLAVTALLSFAFSPNVSAAAEPL